MTMARKDLILNAEISFNDDTRDSLRVFAQCGDCLMNSAPQFDDGGYPLSGEQAANLQWLRCAQCRSATHDWYRPSSDLVIEVPAAVEQDKSQK
jgi:hypothetical protein